MSPQAFPRTSLGGGGASTPTTLGTGDGVTLSFATPAGTNGVSGVFLDGLLQPPANYSFSGGNIVFGAPHVPPNGVGVEAQLY